MDPIRTRCGMRCDICPAFLPNRAAADLERARALWAELFGVDQPAEALACGGCRGETSALLDKECPVRPCVIERGFEDCGDCPDMPCEDLKRRWVERRQIEARLGHALTEDDYRKYILAFENAPYLVAKKAGGAGRARE